MLQICLPSGYAGIQPFLPLPGGSVSISQQTIGCSVSAFLRSRYSFSQLVVLGVDSPTQGRTFRQGLTFARALVLKLRKL